MAIKIICDKCGKEIDENLYATNKLCKNNLTIRFPTEYRSRNEVICGTQARIFYLCPQCQDDVLNYITGGRKIDK